jgi:hypothetical protein
MRTRVIAVALGVALLAGWAPPADAAFVGKRAARAYLLHAVPRGAPRVLLRDERAGFFRTARVWIQPARRCHRRATVAVSCRMRTRLVPDAAHRAENWWPISCSGSVLVRRLDDGRLKGSQLGYTCRTVRP